jgi:2-methylcitrate dehydratase PrpD
MTHLNRRNFLGCAGGVFTASALRAAEAPVSLATARLSAYMSQAAARALPTDVLEQAKFHILDTFGAMISGAQLAPGKVAIRFARARAGEKTATVAASNVVCGAIDAALANGILAHSDETDDYDPNGTHPGCAIVPAALASGEQFGCDGMRFIRGVALGYDLAARMAFVLGGHSFNSEGHKSIHSATATFGSAAAAGSVAGFNERQMRFALDYSAQQSSGIAAWQRDTEHIEKAFVFAGMPARNGVTAALLIDAGASGVDDILSGKDNFIDAYAPGAKAEILTDKLGERYAVAHTTIKKWTVGGPIQAALDSLYTLLKKRPFEADQVQKLIVKLGPRMGPVVNNRDMPDICVQHMLAVMLLDKTASFEAAHDKPRMQDPAVLKQRAKIELQFDPIVEPNIEARQAIVEVTFSDGARLFEHTRAVRGTPDNPMTREEIVGKARDLITPVLGASKTDQLIARTLDLEHLKNVRELRPLLQTA